MKLSSCRGAPAPRSLQAIAEANDEKTGVLFACALEMAALVAGAPQAVGPLRAAAAELGQAFRLRDDLEDGGVQALPPDKDRHQDCGKSTMVALLGRAAVEQRLHAHLARTEALASAALGDAEVLLGLLHRAFPVPIRTPQDAAVHPHVDVAKSRRGTAARPVHGSTSALSGS